MYIKRHMERSIAQYAKMFGAILVTGPRQVGKTTLLKTVKSDIAYITLDDPIMLQSAVNDAGAFFKITPPPVFVDEIQYAPNLFPYIKMVLDHERKKGQFYLSGSQQFHMMKNVSESLAGRIGIMQLLGLSMREIRGIEFYDPFIPTMEFSQNRRVLGGQYSYHEVWEHIQRGSMPELVANPDYDWSRFYGAYVKTYIERDVRELTQVGDEVKFLTFMTVVAGCTGQLLNLASMARDVGVSQPTAERWLSILVASDLVYLLRPYSNNMTNRAVKTPKLYFLDTGLAAYLTRWSNPDVLLSGAMAGPFFETFVVSEIIKSYYNTGIPDLPLYFYRDRDGNEIDLLIHHDGKLFPIEIKKRTDPSRDDVKAFSQLDRINGISRGTGCIICMADNYSAIDTSCLIIPVWMI